MNLDIVSKQKRRAVFLFIIYLCFWLVLHEILIAQFPKPAKIPSLNFLWNFHKNVMRVLNDINFWSTSVGVLAYIFFELTIVTFILFTFSKLFNISTNFLKCLIIVIASHWVFLVQHIFECFFVIDNATYFTNFHRENFSLFSISFFLNQVKISYNTAFYYAFGAINFFEIIYWGLLVFFTMKINHVNYTKAVKLISFSYLPIFFLWIITVTFINLMNS